MTPVFGCKSTRCYPGPCERLLNVPKPAKFRFPAVCILALFIVSCAGEPAVERDEPEESIFGPGGINLFKDGTNDDAGGGSGVAVNAFLWRAALDTVSFMPLAAADPFGGTIITDWYQTAENPTERFKITVYILDRALRSDGLRVKVFRQVRGTSNAWLDAGDSGRLSRDLENTILARARELRINNAPPQ